MCCETVGEIYKVKNGNAIIVAPISPFLLEKQKINKCLVRFDDGRTINAEQRKKAYAIIADITEYTGNLPEYEKEIQKYFYISRYGAEYFSLSDCTISTARDFISYLIDLCFENNIGTRDTLLNCTDDINRYLYSCLANRKCAVCNRKADVHHVEGSRIGMGFDRRKANHVGRKAIALCRKCHSIAHNDEVKFLEANHIYGIPLDAYLVKKLKL